SRPVPARAPRRSATARPATTRTRAAPQRRRGRSNTPVAGFVPVVVGKTAGAVGGIADSGFVVRMTRGRIWIGVLGALLVGIVALNVWALGLNASSSRVAHQTDGLKRANSALQAQIASELSNEQVQAAASQLGLIVPEPGVIRYLASGANTATLAARRLADGALTPGTVAPRSIPPAPVAPAAAPVAAEDPAVAPVAEPPAEAVAPVAPPATAAGGVVAP
ncbi:MAG: hypothetical protein ACR2G3_04710, partial [Solirubrobacterales bacterium]